MGNPVCRCNSCFDQRAPIQPAPILAGAEPLVNVTSQAPINGNATVLTSLLSFSG